MATFNFSIHERTTLAYRGKFTPKSPSKYKGDPTNIVYRSSWELRFMKYCDTNPSVLEWSSEEHVVPYVSPIDNRPHRYFVDFVVVVRKADGSTQTMMVEVKPKAQTRPPVNKAPHKRPGRRYINEVCTWGVNSAKWTAAERYCETRGWQFILLTEDHLGK